ncbi:hypothetical protein GOP47_0023761 [Adiantum capillus-veneris]|uniref:Longin domain-containing protein n=1 Tax=Adiantum capillus-veneris TaxID=13818 RepID=A0A9D4Z685_ADICA|nr:hypothetical protein GOP47_0023761 [Adiantum capillus-veneris]
MLRRISFSSAPLLSDGLCKLQDEPPLSSLVHYSAVSKGTIVLSEYTQEGRTESPGMAAACLENVPPLHARFSYTTHQRRFICLLDGVATYCAIMDEGLSKADAFSFLQKVRDAFHAFGKGRGMSLTLGAHFLDDEMTSVMSNLAASFVGIPQREKDRIQAEYQTLSAAGVDLDVSSPSAVAPLDDMSDHEFNLKTEEGRLGSRALWLTLIGKARKGKKKDFHICLLSRKSDLKGSPTSRVPRVETSSSFDNGGPFDISIL